MPVPKTLPLPSGEEIWRRIPWTEDLEFSNLCRMRRPSPAKHRDGYFYYRLTNGGNSYGFRDWYNRPQMVPWRRLLVAMFPDLYDAYLASLSEEEKQRKEKHIEEMTVRNREKARQQYPEAYERARKIRERYVPGKVTMNELACEYGVSRTTVMLILQNKLQYDPDYTPIKK